MSDRTITRAAFLADPGAASRRAETEGPVTIVDDAGKPRMIVNSSPLAG